MIKRTIAYEDFNGNPQTEEAYFNLSKSELIEMEVEYKQGFVDYIQAIVDANDRKELIAQFKTLILKSYGLKSADGRVFEKSDALRDEFSNTAAYTALFMELATDEGAAAVFINGVVPSDLSQDQDKPVGPPPAPSTAAVMPPPVSQ